MNRRKISFPPIRIIIKKRRNALTGENVGGKRELPGNAAKNLNWMENKFLERGLFSIRDQVHRYSISIKSGTSERERIRAIEKKILFVRRLTDFSSVLIIPSVEILFIIIQWIFMLFLWKYGISKLII